MSDIVKRLQAPAYWISGSNEGHEGENDAPREAADTITRLTAEVEKLRAALEGVLKAGVYNDACECMSCEMARAALSGDNP